MSALGQTFNQDASGNLGITASTLPLPTGASTSALQTTTNATLASISAQLPATLGQKTMAASEAVTIASDQTAIPISAASLPLPTGAATAVLQSTGNASLATIATNTTAQAPASTGTMSSVSGSASSVSLLASNASRKGAIITNDSTAILYVAVSSTTASITAYTVKLYPNASYLLDFVYTGAINGIWASAAGAARITELT